MRKALDSDIASEALFYAEECHRSTNHLYGDQPYMRHLEHVVDVAARFKHLIPNEDWYEVMAGCWVHDVIEDTRQTYNDVKAATSERVADLAFALTNEKGKTRKDRANDKYYAGIRECKHATFIKLCDRIANVEHSIKTGSSMLKAYQRENESFVLALADGSLTDMWNHLHSLLYFNDQNT